VLAGYLKFIIYVKRSGFIILGIGRSVFPCAVVVWILSVVTQYSGVISGFSGMLEFISIWEVYIRIFNSRAGSKIIAVIICINDLSARFAVILVTVVQSRILTDAKNDSLFSGIEVKG
jgi:hypothetical protein